MCASRGCPHVSAEMPALFSFLPCQVVLCHNIILLIPFIEFQVFQNHLPLKSAVPCPSLSTTVELNEVRGVICLVPCHIPDLGPVLWTRQQKLMSNEKIILNRKSERIGSNYGTKEGPDSYLQPREMFLPLFSWNSWCSLHPGLWFGFPAVCLWVPFVVVLLRTCPQLHLCLVERLRAQLGL